MVRTTLLAVFLLLAFPLWAQMEGPPPPPANSAEDRPDPLALGIEREVEVIMGIDHVEYLNFQPSTARGAISVGEPSLLKYELIPQKRQITFKGVKKGRTSVTLRDDTGDIKATYLVDIKEHGQQKIIRDLQEFFKGIEGVQITTIGDAVVVQGEIVVPSDIGRVNMVLQKYQDVMNFVELSPQSKVLVAKRMQDEIQINANLKQVTVRVVNGQFWLEGTVSEEREKTRAEEIVKAYLPDNIESLARRMDTVQKVQQQPFKNFIAVNPKNTPAEVPKLLKFTAQFVELTKDYNRVFGFKWIPLMEGNGGTISIGKTQSGGVKTSSSGTLTATISNLFPKLSSAQAAGHAKVIQSGIVITEVGRSAKITKNTRKDYEVGTGENTKSSSSNAGFDLVVGDGQGDGATPRLLNDDTIETFVSVSVKMMIGSTERPEQVNNDIQTRVVIKSHESAVIGGLVANTSTTDYDKNPPGGNQAPSTGSSELFSFIRSKRFEESKSQFVVFLTPEVIESASTGIDEIKRKFRSRR
jgi:pilus assembly protein CpaC